MATPEPDERLRQAAVHADKIRDAILNLLDSDAAAAAQIRKGSDRILAVADQIHKQPLPTRSQVGLLHDQVTVTVTRPDWPVWS